MIKLKYPNFWSNKNWISTLLVPASWIYIFLGYIRKKLTKQIKLSQRVICVGNANVGGSGKTQVVAWLAQILANKNISFVIITKAYRSKLKGARLVSQSDLASQVGDESLILAQFGQVIASKQIKNAIELINQLNPQIVILDDGMQNPSLYKDVQILLLPSETQEIKSIRNNRIFPAGPFRESIASGVKKANFIFVLGKTTDQSLPDIINVAILTFFAHTKLLTKIDKTKDYIAFAGIGHPENFFSLLINENVTLKQKISFQDHHNYKDDELKELLKLAREKEAVLITTEKDYIKLHDIYKKQITCAKVTLEFENEKECIKALINDIQNLRTIIKQ